MNERLKGKSVPLRLFLYEMSTDANNNRNRMSKRWTFTINNPTDPVPYDVTQMDFLIYQRERGENGTEHFQGYVVFKNRKRLQSAKAMIDERAHMEIARGSDEQNIAYCSKPDTRIGEPTEFGDRPTGGGGQGKRNDLTPFVTAIREKRSFNELLDTFPAECVRYTRAIRDIRLAMPPPRRDAVRVIVLWGPTGTGKTYAAFQHFPNLYRVNYGNGGVWFDGYAGEDVILLDEYDSQIPLAKLIPLLDPYPLRCEFKGGHANAEWTTVIITSNTSPATWYKFGQDQPRVAALLRRCEPPTGVTIEFADREAGNAELSRYLN